jgi:5'-nucleotidase
MRARTSTDRRRRRRLLTSAASGAAFGVVGALVAAVPQALAAPTGDGVVINEVYVNGGSAGAPFVDKFVELYNPTSADISLSGWSIQYRPASGSAAFTNAASLSGSIPTHGHYLIAGGSNAGNGAALPTPDLIAPGINPANGGGAIALSNSTATLSPGTGSITGDPAIVDLVGWGTSNTFETAAAPAPASTSDARSLNRTDFVDSDSNAADFTLSSSVTPTASTSGGGDDEPTEATIEEIQGAGAASPLVGDHVVTTGVVTAAYPTGGFNGFYIQTPGTGGDLDLDAHHASDGVFVFGSSTAGAVEIGDYVQVTGHVSEFNGLTEVQPDSSSSVVALADPVEAPKPATVSWPSSDAVRETLEGMLVAPQGDYTVTDNFNLNAFGEIGLAVGDAPLRQPTDVAPPFDSAPGADNSAYNAVVADNAARLVTLDDGASLNFLNAANQGVPLPYLTPAKPVRVGAPATFTQPVVVDWRNGQWDFQPTQRLTADNADAVQPATFANTRETSPAAVGGDVKIASFNVLNYFTTTGDDYVAGGGSCTFYDDRAGNPITVNDCGEDGPRGAADDESLQRQQDKIVHAINALDASVLSLEEIENAAKFGEDRDASLAALVQALNADAGSSKWAYVPTPTSAGDQADEDVIRTAFIYQPALVAPAGPSVIDDAPAFANARDPLAQAWQPVGGGDDSTFVVIVNHFKSKGSGTGDDADQGDGQGASNHSRVLQAEELVDFADAQAAAAGTDLVFLDGDFNSYTREDPMQVFYDAGYTDIGSTHTDESTYLFDGVVGSLDHVLASPAALDTVTGADVWDINSVESVALEYSRYNYNATIFYDQSPFRSSDHDPLIVGVDLPDGLPSSTVSATARPVVYGHVPRIKVTVTSTPKPTGQVQLREGETALATAALHHGKATITLARDALAPGTHHLTVVYRGSATVAGSSAAVDVSVAKVSSKTRATTRPHRVVVGQTRAQLAVEVTAKRLTPTGSVTVRTGGAVVGSATLDHGAAVIELDPFTSIGRVQLVIEYSGDAFARDSAVVKSVSVVRPR